MKPGDWLLSAHHRDDQAETLLLNLIRGSGPAGIAGIAGIRRFGPGWLARPLLGTDKTAIEKYAADALLEWVNDPSNENRRFDRNYLRHDVFPALHSRWSDIATRLQRSAIHAGEAAVLLDELAAMDLEQRGRGLARLPIDKLRELSQARQRNAIRFALRELSLSTPATVHLDAVMHELLPAREDAQPIVRWPGACIRRYRNGLYLLPEKPCPKLKTVQFAAETVELGPGLGRLRLEPGGGLGLSQALVARGLRIECRVGGEEIKPYHQRHTRKLKNLLQEEGIVPWMRDRLPLVYSGERLIAVGDLWMADDAVTKPGVVLRWDDRPALQ
jgi:tRNA(Ile)-lysidine synthase